MFSFVGVNVWEQLSQKAAAYVPRCAETGVCNPIDTAESGPPTDRGAHGDPGTRRVHGVPEARPKPCPGRTLAHSTETKVGAISVNLELVGDPLVTALRRGGKGVGWAHQRVLPHASAPLPMAGTAGVVALGRNIPHHVLSRWNNFWHKPVETKGQAWAATDARAGACSRRGDPVGSDKQPREAEMLSLVC